MPPSKTRLRIDDHSRASAGMTYVYPVISRRAGGVSVGVNLNPNNACNWRCVYCQVPGLKRGGPPPVDLGALREELTAMLRDVLHGTFMERRVPPEARHLMDVALSGNGEPTTAREFPAAIAVVAEIVEAMGLRGRIPIRLITNGSQLDRPAVQEGLRQLARAGGEVWFKLDAGNAERIARINNARTTMEGVLRRLRRCAALCPTWVQTCLFETDGKPPSEPELDDYIQAVACVSRDIKGVHLYGLARPSTQPEAPRLGQVPRQWMEGVATRLRNLGLRVTVSP